MGTNTLQLNLKMKPFFFSAGDVCALPKLPGICMAYFPRWFFNRKTKKCESFIYGGCNGNANNFNTEGECNKSCSGNFSLREGSKHVMNNL